MLCVNMQTSFLHPPFGFALFYLRGVAPKEVKSSDIYWGAIPWIGLQAIMVAIVIAFPITVTALLDKPLDVDLTKVRIEVPQIELPPLDFGAAQTIAKSDWRDCAECWIVAFADDDITGVFKRAHILGRNGWRNARTSIGLGL